MGHALYWILGVVVGLFVLTVLSVYLISLWKENKGHRGAHSFEGGPIKESEREVWGDPTRINAPPRRKDSGSKD
jgi:hypothetical protein